MPLGDGKKMAVPAAGPTNRCLRRDKPTAKMLETNHIAKLSFLRDKERKGGMRDEGGGSVYVKYSRIGIKIYEK